MSSTLTVTNLTATNLTDGGGTTSTFANVVDGSAKAFVNFNGTGTVAIRGSQNVTSITDNASGDYDINFTNNMGNSNYCTTGSCAYVSGTGQPNVGHNLNTTTKSTTDEHIFVVYAQSVSDSTFVEVAIHGDLA